MKILYVINSVEGGGAALPVPALVRTLARHGAAVTVLALTRRDGRALPAFAAGGVAVEVRNGGERDHLAALRWLDARVAAHRPDALWTSLTRATLLGQWVGQRRRLPVVSWQHAAFLKPANRFLLRQRQRHSALWVADSRAIARLTEQRLGVSPDRLMTWPIFFADPAAPLAEPWRPGNPVRLGSLGRLHPVKGYDVLVAALARLAAEGFTPPAPWQLQIAGEGAEEAALRAQLAAANLAAVELTGYAADPRAFLARQHAYLQPSRSEGFCVAAHEAMQAGLPVLASAVGELAHSVEPGVSGWLVPPGDPVALAAALRNLLGAPETLAAMGAAARAAVLDRFSEAAFDRAGTAILERLAAIVQAR